MEKNIDLKAARTLMGKNIIGPDELYEFSEKIGIRFSYKSQQQVPRIPFKYSFLENVKDEYLMVLGSDMAYDGKPLTIYKLRENFGIDPQKSEPCFYNQDWYLKEKFIFNKMSNNWFLIRKELKDETRGKEPNKFNEINDFILPSAVMLCYAFFSHYIINNEELWKNDYAWCDDFDHNGDQIYVGRYRDPAGQNKNGFSIHRHLRLTHNYGLINFYK